ncbi:MAG: ABC transporter permease [Anaerolineales bacterium]|jgi:putative ABC transport system permease protein|nr:ABC transporter permease [Chloroflexota bacterium]MBK6644221.1 ABC transporter permease [Anaerolineales bacterium]
MKPTEALTIAWEAVLKNKIRSLLTMLGIIIGVSAVIIMVAISAGTEATIQDQITSLGSNLVFVQSSMMRGGPGQAQQGGLVYDDAAAIEDGVTGVTAVVVEQNSSETIKYGDVTLEDVEILGTTVGFPSVRDMEISDGRYFNDQEIERKSKVVVLGYSLAQELFGETNPIGQYVKIGNTKQAVIGVFTEKGLVGNTDFDSRAYLPISVVFQKFTPSQFARFMGDSVRMIYVEVDPDANLDNIITQIELLLVKRHDVTLDSADFSVTTQQDIISTQESTTAAFRSLLAWVAGVSLIVGGIGIMNIMLVSVTERTREIGIRQSIGATPNDIRIQFLTEALLLSIIGGLIGVLVGVGGAYIFGALSDMRTVISVSSILLAFGSSAIVGAFFGYYPADQASKLDPIEALRYE